MSAETYLILAPHHDDESIGCGGSIKLLTKGGAHVHLAVVTSGCVGVPGASGNQASRIREKETLSACEILGIQDATFLRLKDLALEFNEANLHAIVEIVRKVRPTTIFLPHQQEMDRDHRIVNELGREASWIAGLPGVLPAIEPILHRIRKLFYEVWTPMQTPHESRVIDDVWEDKIRAIQQHQSQLQGADYVRMATGLNQFRAIQQFTDGVYAESFSHS